MKKLATSIRCVPRYGYDGTEVRTIELDLPHDPEPDELHELIETWFRQCGISDAVFDIGIDDDGFFVVVNDEAYHDDWGTPLL